MDSSLYFLAAVIPVDMDILGGEVAAPALCLVLALVEVHVNDDLLLGQNPLGPGFVKGQAVPLAAYHNFPGL